MKRFLLVLLVAAALLPPRARAGEIVVNGGFEAAQFGPAWTHGAYRKNKENPSLADHAVVPDLPYSGSYSALLGFKYTGQGNATAYLYQDVAIPANISSATLRFALRMQGYDGDFYAQFTADLRTTGGAELENLLSTSFSQFDDKFKDSGWMVEPGGYDVSPYAGQTVRLYFAQPNLNDNNLQTWTYVDDVSLVYRKWVDLFADGDGDDAFGAIGSGAGGFSARSAVAGDTLYYALTVENEGPVADTYTLSASAPSGWTALIDAGAGPQAFPFTTPSVASGTSLGYTVMVVSPPGAGGGSYDVVVDAESDTAGNRFDSARLRANVVDAVYATDLVVEGNGFGVTGGNGAGGFALGTTTWDTPRSFAVELRNPGNQTTAYRIDVATDAGASASVWLNGTQFTAPFTTPGVPDGGSIAMTVDVTVAAPQRGGDYAAILTAAAVGDTLRRDSIEAVARVLEPRVDMIVVTNGDNIYDDTGSGFGGSSTIASELGLTVSFPILVQNEAAIADSFIIDWVPPSGGWRAVLEIGGVDYDFPVTTPAFAPFTQQSYVLKVEIRNGASYGTYRSLLNAVSATDGRVAESVAASISVSNSSEIDMLIDGDGAGLYGPVGTGLGGLSSRDAAPGDTVFFDVTVVNVSGIDSHDLAWSAPAGWDVTLAGSSTPLSALPAGTYALRVVVPSGAPRGTFDVIVDGNKTDKTYLMDSVTGRVVVVPGARVDAVIDNDGDGVFGAPGTGAGGTSLQAAPAGATVNFTVELQNEGAADDTYRVTWGAVPGWTAALSGSPSPLVTAPIPAGGSSLYTFRVDIPAAAATGAYAYTLDVQSLSDSTSFESIAARVDVLGPPRADLVIDGDGTDVFGVMGSGQGGRSVRYANPGSFFTAQLRVRNAGSFADSMRVQWEAPPGWPAGSVVINDGAVDHSAPFWTPVLAGGAFVDYTVKVQVPADAASTHSTIINAWSSLPPNLTESVVLVTDTRIVVRGVVFDDRDRNLVFSGADAPLSGVTVVEQGSGLAAVTDAAGSYTIQLTGPATVTVVERNPSGYVSLTNDTLGAFVVDAGDTVTADFADAAPLRLTPGTVRTALAGGYVDFPHVLEVGTAGHVDLSALADGGGTAMFLLDANGNGVFDTGDRALESADTDLDPGTNARVAILCRLFVPSTTPEATTIHVKVTATEAVGAVTITADAVDAAVVTGSAVGLVTLSKSADVAGAAPGESITYSIEFFNSGADSVQNLVIVDPISPWVDLEADAFGPGRDLEWQRGSDPPVYLTFDPGDTDACEFSPAERLLRLIFAQAGATYLEPGGTGRITYRVRVR